MKMLSGFAIALVLSSLGTTAATAPICAEFMAPEKMPKKYAKYAPILSDGPEGWIIAQDQLKQEFAPSKEAVILLGKIAEEFEALGVPLAIMIPPPRPLVAGEDKLNALGAAEGYDSSRAGQSFSALIHSLRQAGFVAPNLLDLALSDKTLQNAFYFQRDTHWTPAGAAHSALVLAEQIRVTHPDRFPNAGAVTPTDLSQGPVVDEKGSLANIARKVCGAEISPETVETLTFPASSGALLSNDTEGKPVVALAGSSFSDRYQRDFYRVADSIAGALDAEVENYSVSGGGAIGGLESLILSGELSADRFDLVVWELPYTERFRSTHFLRQLLGALRYDPKNENVRVVSIDENKKSLKLDFNNHRARELVIRLPESDAQKVTARLRTSSGKKTTIKLSRRDRVPANRRSDIWAVSFEGLEGRQFSELTLDFGDATPGKNATATLLP